MRDVHDRSFYLALADAEALAAKMAPSREAAALHLQMKAMYLKQAHGQLSGETAHD